MRIRSLRINGFRNHSDLLMTFDFKNTFIQGENASGKTSILEAISFLSIGRSFKRANSEDLINHSSLQASLYLIYSDDLDSKDHSISCLIDRKNKAFAIDDEKVSSLSKILGKLLTVVYEPSLVFFFRDSPEYRRRFLDESLSQLSPRYLYAISRYKKLLKERNTALLREYDRDVIDVLRDEMINLSYRIVKERKEIISKLDKKANSIYKELFGSNDKELKLFYKSNCSTSSDQSSFVIEQKDRYEKNRSDEMLKKTTSIGPHRDDMIATLNGKAIEECGSQGENRIASLAVRLALAEVIKEELRREPILLLDDVCSDLDEKRRSNLFTLLSKGDKQVIITGTDERYVTKEGLTFNTRRIEDEQ